MNSEKKLEINVLSFNNDNIKKDCGYCKSKIPGRYSFSFTADKFPVDIYDNMKKDGWGRCGDLIYFFNGEKSCCKFFASRLNALDFQIKKEQKKIMNRFEKYLTGEYELNKEKLKQKEQRKETNMKNIDELQKKIEKILTDYLKQKKYFQIIEKYIKIDNSLFVQKLNEIHVKKNINKKFNCDYSIDFIYVIIKIIESEIIKNLQLDLFNDFKKFYTSENEDLELSDKTGHINIIDKTKLKKIIEKNKPKKIIEKNKPKKIIEKNKPKKIIEKNKPEKHLPKKHKYTCELTDKILIDDEKFKVYEKYQKNILKSPKENITKEYYDEIFGKTNLIDNKGIQLPKDLDNPEIYPKKYGTYNFIHRIDGKIIAVGVWDILPTSLCSVSLYYDPEYKFLDLGIYTAIKEIEYVQKFHDLIDNNFKYYSMGIYCETAQKLRYKGFFEPTEILDRYTMNYVYLKDVQKIISDGKNHILSKEKNNPNKKFMTEDEINKYINDLIEDFKKNKEDNYFKNEVIENTKRFIELVPTYLINQFKFIAKPDN